MMISLPTELDYNESSQLNHASWFIHVRVKPALRAQPKIGQPQKHKEKIANVIQIFILCTLYSISKVRPA